MDCSLKLGQSTNLLENFKATSFLSHTLPPSTDALYEEEATITQRHNDAVWSWPAISLHRNSEDLLSVLIQIKLICCSFENAPEEGEGFPLWPVGSLVLAGITDAERQNQLANISREINLDLNNDEWSYALVIRKRLVGSAVHPCCQNEMFRMVKPIDKVLKPDTLQALKNLPKISNDIHLPDVNEEGAKEYVQFYYKFGSHFISKLYFGDCIFQVFAYSKDQYSYLCKIYNENPSDLSGPKATSFSQYTIKRNDTGYGYCAAASNICIASNDPALQSSLLSNKWYDNKYALYNSIFTPYIRSDSVDINKLLIKCVAIGIELSSLRLFAEYIRKRVWHNVFKGAMYVKTCRSQNVAPYFSNNCPHNFASIYKNSGAIVSDIATPVVDLFQEYIQLDSMRLKAAEIVSNFTLFSNAFTIKNLDTEKIPGSKSVTIISHVITAKGSGARPPTLSLSDEAFQKIKTRLSCQQFYGGLLVRSCNGSNHLVIMNGIVFEMKDGKVIVTGDIRKLPSSDVLTEYMTDYKFALVAAEARLNFAVQDPSYSSIIPILRSLLTWLGQIASLDSANKALQARALYLAKVTGSSKAMKVPFLKYETYEDAIQKCEDILQTVQSKITNYQMQIRERQQEERQITRDNVLNENTIKTGQLILRYIATQASYEKMLNENLSLEAGNIQNELKVIEQRATVISRDLNEQKVIVEQKVSDYKEAVKAWQEKETIRAALDIASNLFTLAFTFITPSTAFVALASLGATVQKIQKAVKVFDALIQTYRSFETIPSNPQNVIEALTNINDPNGLDLPSTLEWDEMKVNMDSTLDTGPDIPAKSALSSAFAVLVLRGKALVDIQNALQSKLTELSGKQSRANIHKEQEKKLEQLNTTFSKNIKDIDPSSVDFIGLTGQLTFIEHQMLMTMTSILVTQDEALQYEYLQKTASMDSFSFISLQMGMVQQTLAINRGLQVQPIPQLQPHPIIYEIHGVTPEALTHNTFSFKISPSCREFAGYNYVRVARVRAEIGGILSTKSGKYYVELQFDGQPFYDRDFNGGILTFQTISRIYTFLNDVSSSAHSAEPAAQGEKIPPGPFSDKASTITPFSQWSISLPQTQSNEEIKFDQCTRGVTIRLIFDIYAQLIETSTRETSTSHASRSKYASYLRQRIPLGVVDDEETMKYCLCKEASAEDAQSFHVGDTKAFVSDSDVLQMMENKSVCFGWDAVLSVSAKQINDNLYDQYKDRVSEKAFLRSTGDVVKEFKTSEGYTTKTTFNFVFKAPKLQFLLNRSESAQLYLPIKSGHYEYSIKMQDKWAVISKSDAKESDNFYVKGEVPLAVLQGDVSTQHNISLKLNGGSFSSQGFQPGTENPMMNQALTDYFTSLKDGYEVYNLGTLDTKNVTLLQCLTPKTFQFNVFHSPSNRDILQVFITTQTGVAPTDTILNLHEPIPSNYECSLIISSEIFFKELIPTTIGKTEYGFEYKCDEPQNNSNKDKAWSTSLSKGSLQCPYPVSMVRSYSQSVPSARVAATTHYKDYVAVDGDSVTLCLKNMAFSHGDKVSNWSAKASFLQDKEEYGFRYGTQSQVCTLWCSPWSRIAYTNHSVKVTIRMDANLIFTVTGKGQQQNIQLQPVLPDEAKTFIHGQIEPPAGFCKTNDRDLQISFVKRLNSEATPMLKKVFDRNFTSVSLFALKNILFPAKNLLNLEKVFVPGDMVIFGKFIQEY